MNFRFLAMKKIKLTTIFLALIISSTAIFTPLVQGNINTTTIEELWKKVEEAGKNGLPKTMIEHLNEIIPLCIANKQYGQAVKALAQKIVFDANIKGNKTEEKVKGILAEIENAPDEIKPVMEMILAKWYWQYYKRNRYRFQNRSATISIDDVDFTTWDLPRLFDHIDGLYSRILDSSDVLKATSIAMLEDLLQKGNTDVSIRPTLYDFAVHEAIEFYLDGDQHIKKPEDVFEINSDSDALAPFEIFVNYSPETTDKDSPKLKAINLYKDIIAFHVERGDREALAEADLNRIQFVHQSSFGESKNERYFNRLKEIMGNYSDLNVASMAAYHWANELKTQGKLVEAHEIAMQGTELHPKSMGADNCLFLIRQIESKEFNIESEYTFTPSLKELNIDYKNIDTLSFRIVKDQWEDFIGKKGEKGFPAVMRPRNRQEVKKLLSKSPARSWTVTLEETTDYKIKSEIINIPDLEPGFYRLIASWDKDFSGSSNAIRVVSFWVTKIGLVMRQDGGQVDGFIVDADTGKPLSGAKVRVFQMQNTNDYRNRYFTETEGTYSDDDGYFSPNIRHNTQSYFHVTYQDQELFHYSGTSSRDAPRTYASRSSTLFFTDRSIYRPGQMIHFKALSINQDQGRDTYDFIPNRDLVIVFRDHNRQEVERMTLTTNSYGSVSGTFTAPSGKLTGLMTISCENIRGNARVRVEEYKRPKFKVALNQPEMQGKLGEEITLSGNATAYTGAPIDDGKVKFRVVREVRYPRCWYYWGRSAVSESREITHGRVKTDETGKFDISFIAHPDRSADRKDDPTFIYSVYADVTDSTGETRSDSINVHLGYKSLVLNAEVPKWIESENPFEVKVSSSTLSGESVKVSGDIAIYSLTQPDKPARGPMHRQQYGYHQRQVDPTNWKIWDADLLIEEQRFDTSEGVSLHEFNLASGAYKVVVTSQDKDGEEVISFEPFLVFNTAEEKFNVKIPHIFTMKSGTIEPGNIFKGLWGTGYDFGMTYVEIEHRGEIVKKYWTDPSKTQDEILFDVEEKHRGGFVVRLTQVSENRAYLKSQVINVPWSNKKLDLSFESFRSKLVPGQEETWTVKIKGPDAEIISAEMVAGLYDASLDAFYSHSWRGIQNIFRKEYSGMRSNFGNIMVRGFEYLTKWNKGRLYIGRTAYWQFPREIVYDFAEYAFPSTRNRFGGGERMMAARGMADQGMLSDSVSLKEAPGAAGVDKMKKGLAKEPPKPKKPDLLKVSARKNLNETAFFYPHLKTDSEGVVKISFTMPEALTEWNFMGFAHAKGLLSGMLKEKTVTQKDLMIQPNPPRFLREGDELEFTAKITNLSEEEQTGLVKLALSDARSLDNVDVSFGNDSSEQTFSVPAKRSRTISWKLQVPDFSGVLIYKVVAATDTLSDGEENYLPVLSKRVFVTESLPLPIRGPDEKTFEFTKLMESGNSDTLVHKALTVQMVSNPSWYAVQALPYLMEFPHECSEQIFNRIYANSLAKYIANSNPKIRTIFDQWKGTDALKSNLQKNEDLKSVILEETPWVRAAQSESESKNQVGLLFDENHMRDALSRAHDKLSARQLSNGAWSWFPGGRENFYMTLYIMTGYGRLQHMNVDVDISPAMRSLDYLDAEINRIYREILKDSHPEWNHLSSTIAMYLYGRSFFVDAKPIPRQSQEAVDYFLGQANEYWLEQDSRLTQGYLALACKRFGDPETAENIVNSLRERSVNEEEMGMYWQELERSWWWYRAPIETQAIMIEVFDEIANDEKAVEDLKVWLIKQKQTQDWKTTKATADAVYGLLLRGDDLLASDEIVQVSLGDLKIEPENIEAGTGFYEKKFIGGEIEPSYGEVTVTKVDKGVAWGSLHWQYMEDMSKVTPHKTPLHLEKALYVERETKAGPKIELIDGPLEVGDKIHVRITLRVDRDMEYVHMKDFRGSGTEPTNVLSRYKYQDGLAYYESTRDTATNFFIDYLPKGTYVFEYPVMVQHKGRYQMGMATIQSMYAPEFNSHSGSEFIEVE